MGCCHVCGVALYVLNMVEGQDPGVVAIMSTRIDEHLALRDIFRARPSIVPTDHASPLIS